PKSEVRGRLMIQAIRPRQASRPPTSTQLLTRDDGVAAMNGSQAPARNMKSPAPKKALLTIWTLIALAAVVAASVTIRLLGAPQAVAQAPSGKQGAPAIPTRPGGAPTQGNLNTIPRAATSPQPAAAQPQQPVGQV